MEGSEMIPALLIEALVTKGELRWDFFVHGEGWRKGVFCFF